MFGWVWWFHAGDCLYALVLLRASALTARAQGTCTQLSHLSRQKKTAVITHRRFDSTNDLV